MRLPIAKEGLVFVLPSLALSLILFLIGAAVVAGVLLLVVLFFLYFFRNPARSTESGGDELLSPADGRVTAIEEIVETRFLKEKAKRISIFMSVTDVHVNRAPCDGDVERLQHEDGRFRLAFKKGVDEENERNYILIRNDDESFLLVQIAGFLARRIVCYVRERDRLGKGQPVGMIAFGSRVDIYMPLYYEAAVGEGQKVKSGLTVLARKGDRT